ncbi:hypothetical protein IG631_04884 [Alternaria alternata]|nr:hypothetical protein IG631_04884 [Alternaria alternata]
MDPLSITASTITVISAVSAAFKGVKRLYNAPGEIESILNDLVDTQVNLKWIEDGLLQYRTSNRCDERQYQEIGKQLLLAKATVQELLKSIKLDSVTASPNTPSARWAWVRAKGKVQKLKHRVEEIRAVIVRLQASFER